MRLNSHWITLAGVALAAVMSMGLAACSDSQAAGSYVLVTELRPASREQYVAYQRSVYELCAVILANHERVAKPFPEVSHDFFGTRTTYAGDGKRTVVRERVDKLDFVTGNGENNCEMRWSTLTSVTLTGAGQKPSAHEGAVAPYLVAQVLEPLSLSVGKPVDPALFVLDKRQ